MAKLTSVKFLDSGSPPHIVTLTLLAGVTSLNLSILLPSLAEMTDYFGTQYAIMMLSVSGYLAATTIVQIAVGPISDTYGRRPVVLALLVLFVLATVGAYFATSVEVFLTFRMLQAIVTGCFVLSRAIVRDMVPAEQAASMIGYVTMGMSIVPMIGPMIGGSLDEMFGWHAILIFLIICTLVVLLLCWRDLGETNQGNGMSFRQTISTYPELICSPRFWGYVMAAALGSGAFFALLGGASFVANTVFELSSFWTGVALGAPALGYAFGNFLSGRFSVRLGINKMILSGAIGSTSALTVLLLADISGLINAAVFFGLCGFLGVGNGILLPNATAGSLSVRPHLAGSASGLGGAISIGGGAVLSALAGYLLTDDSGARPLILLMLVTAVGSILTIAFIYWREVRQN